MIVPGLSFLQVLLILSFGGRWSFGLKVLNFHFILTFMFFHCHLIEPFVLIRHRVHFDGVIRMHFEPSLGRVDRRGVGNAAVTRFAYISGHFRHFGHFRSEFCYFGSNSVGVNQLNGFIDVDIWESIGQGLVAVPDVFVGGYFVCFLGEGQGRSELKIADLRLEWVVAEFIELLWRNIVIHCLLLFL